METCSGLIATTLVFDDSYARPHSKFAVFATQVHILAFDEAQQFGAATDAWLISILPIFALLVFLGDQVQPLGAGSTELQRALHLLLGSFRPALRAEHIACTVPAESLLDRPRWKHCQAASVLQGPIL